MNNRNRNDNVYMIDTKMFGFEKFNAAYIVKGKEIALIDTGPASSTEVLRAGIKAHGFSIENISHLFITHEHNDHCGNAGKLVKENNTIKVYASPIASEILVNPTGHSSWTKSTMKPEMFARFGEMEPVPQSNLITIKEGDTFDLGDGEKLTVFMTPGHQPAGIVIYAEKSKGMFIYDLVGLNLADADAHWIFTPPRSDVRQAMESLKKIMGIPLNKLYLGHFGIWDTPTEVMQDALGRMQWLMDTGARCVAEGKPEQIEKMILERLMSEADKIKKVRGEGLYTYVSGELIPHLGKNFAKYYVDLQKNNNNFSL